ncbi:MAG: PEP-CTERM sorting domain-containing protein [Pirellulales bacterium]
MASSLGRILGAALVSMSLSTVAIAGPLTTDAAALPSWKGSTPFSGTNAGLTHTVDAIVDFAVYAPGNFSLSAALGNPTDISGGTQYIYAYEVFRQGLDADISSLSISLVPGAVPDNTTLVGHDPTTPEGGVAPISSNFVPGGIAPKLNVRWNFIPAMAGSNHSDILFFASPFGPQMLQATVGGTFTTAAMASLPTPIPEPGTWVLMAAGLCSLFALRPRRRRQIEN